MREDYQRALLKAIAVAGSNGKRPARLVVLNAAGAALGVSDRDGLTAALDQLIEAGLVAERDPNRLILTLAGEQTEAELPADQLGRLTSFLQVARKSDPEGLTDERKEILFLVGIGEHHGKQIGAATVGEVLNLSTAAAGDELHELAADGYLVERPVVQGILVYSLSKSGKFELRRGDLRLDSIRYPGTQSDRARELIEAMADALSD